MSYNYGKLTIMSSLPHNTKFYVTNGAWYGKMIHKEDGIYIQTTINDSLCVNGENQFKATDNEELYIRVLKEDLEVFYQNIKTEILPMLDEEFFDGRYGIDILEEYVAKRREEVRINIEKREKSKNK